MASVQEVGGGVRRKLSDGLDVRAMLAVRRGVVGVVLFVVRWLVCARNLRAQRRANALAHEQSQNNCRRKASS